jgi:hypothetical protein
MITRWPWPPLWTNRVGGPNGGPAGGLGSWPPFDGAGMSAWAGRADAMFEVPDARLWRPRPGGVAAAPACCAAQDMANRMAADIVDRFGSLRPTCPLLGWGGEWTGTRPGWPNSATAPSSRSSTAPRLARSRSATASPARRSTSGALATWNVASTASRRPPATPTIARPDWPAELEAQVCELRRAHPRWGARRISHELGRRGVTPTPSDRRCTASWSASTWSARRPNSTRATSSAGSGKRRCSCGSWTCSAGCSWPTGANASC